MEYSNHARARMRLYNISEAEVDNCLNNKSNGYFAGSDVVCTLSMRILAYLSKSEREEAQNL